MFERYKSDPVFQTYVRLWGLVGLLWFLILVALMFIFGDNSWFITATVLIVVLTSIGLLQANLKTNGNATALTIVAVVVTTIFTLFISEMRNPADTIQDHFVSLLNPYWTIIALYWLLLKKKPR